jgi:hypothetical protein
MNFINFVETADHSIFLDLNHDITNPFFDNFFPLLRSPLKFLIDRQRPYEQLESARLLRPFENYPSFPSGHTEMSFLA